MHCVPPFMKTLQAADIVKLCLAALVIFALTAPFIAAQTIFVPGGTVGSSSNGNVGIGTTTPGYRFHVLGANGSATGLFEIGISGVTNGFVVSTNASNEIDYQFRTKNDVVGFAQDPNGNVGIGTTNPKEQLHLLASQGTNILQFYYAHFGSDYSAW